MEIGSSGRSLEKLIRKGAEADIYVGDWYGEKAVFKLRVKRAYLQPALERQVREQRTNREASLIVKARDAGVATPLILFVDAEEGEIVMKFVEGSRAKEIIDGKDAKLVERVCREIGEIVGRLHKANIIHGDLTTSNFIHAKTGQLVILDFGLSHLSDRLEDRAVDLHLIKEVLTSAHNVLADQAFNWILEGYALEVGNKALEKALTKIKEIERRGRYARID